MAIQNTSRPPVNENFGLLPQHRGRFSSFTVSLAVNLALAIFFVWLAMLQLHRQPPPPRYESTALIFQSPPPPPPRLPPVPHIKVTPPPPQVAELPRKIEMPKPQPEPPKPEIVHLNSTPAMPALPPAPPKAVVAPPQPKVGLFASPKPTAVANNKAAPTVQTGGFGDPSGVAANPNATRSATVAMVGSFNAAPGANQGAGAARPGVVQGTGFGSGVANGVPGGTSRGAVASAGFSNGVTGGTPGGKGTARTVATGAFGTGIGGSAPPPAAKVQAVNFVPPEVISEPRPQYTEEARQLKIQGEVTLQVKFGADGKIEVLKVVNHLGHGLDEQAERVAQQIRFRPAARDGHPVDQITYIHILFQLA
jgi:TonB family protein